MNEMDSFLTYLFEDIDDSHIHLFKRIKNGIKYYHLNVNSENQVGKSINSYSDINMIFDVSTSSIELSSSAELQIITIEDRELVNKWVNRFEQYLSKTLESDVKSLIMTSLQNNNNKSILRDYKLKSIDNESI